MYLINKILARIKLLNAIRYNNNENLFQFIRSIYKDFCLNVYKFNYYRKINLEYKKYLKNEEKLISIQDYTYQPLISIIVPLYKTPIEFFDKMILSVISQKYQNWELCLADDNSNDKLLNETIANWIVKDSRIKVVFNTINQHISLNSNSAINISSGEFIAFLDHDDELHPNALIEIVKELNIDNELDFIYTDEDKMDTKNNRMDPQYKTHYSLTAFLSRNFVCHLSIIRKSLLLEIGGFRAGYEGSQDYDLFLRAFQKTNKIKHINKMLYHWRLHNDSVSLNVGAKNYAYTSAIKSLNDFVKSQKYGFM